MPEATDDQLGRPSWISDDLIAATKTAFSRDSDSPLDGFEAVELLTAIGQLLEATGMLKLEIIDDDEEEIHWLGKGQHP